MAKEAEEKKEGEAEAKPKKKGKLLIIIGAVVGMLVVGGGAAFALMGGSKPAEVDHEAEVHEPEPVLKVAKLESFIVNLGSSSSFLRTTILLEYDQNILDRLGAHDKAGGKAKGSGHGGGAPVKAQPDDAVPAIMKPREPMIRDAIIRVLTSKTPNDIMMPEGKESLKEQLIEAVNEALGFEEPPIVNIYFVEFMIQ